MKELLKQGALRQKYTVKPHLYLKNFTNKCVKEEKQMVITKTIRIIIIIKKNRCPDANYMLEI